MYQTAEAIKYKTDFEESMLRLKFMLSFTLIETPLFPRKLHMKKYSFARQTKNDIMDALIKTTLLHGRLLNHTFRL